MIIDAHCHAWERWPYDPAVPDGTTRGSADALLYEMDTNGVERALVVAAEIGAGDAATDNTDNNTYVADAVRAHPDRLAMVADVDSFWSTEYHTDGASDRLSAGIDRTGAVGVAHYVRGPDDRWMVSPAGHSFFRRAARLGLILSLHAEPGWFASVTAVAAAHPTLTILLHHLGHVRDDTETDALVALAANQNVVLKVSGFHYIDEPDWRYPYPAALRRVARLAEAFGADRMVWGSDFPAARRHLTYRQSIELVRTECGFFGDAAMSAVLGGTMERLLAERRIS